MVVVMMMVMMIRGVDREGERGCQRGVNEGCQGCKKGEGCARKGCVVRCHLFLVATASASVWEYSKRVYTVG